MRTRRSKGEVLIEQLMDAIAGFIFLVDGDVSILDYNSSAGRLLGSGRHEVLRRRGGDVLHCVHSKDVAEGRGRGEFCKTCLVRDSVNRAMTGRKCVRRRARMQLEAGNGVSELYILVSAAPLAGQGRPKVLLILQENGEVLQLQSLAAR